jgi:hypothetical protein
MTTFGDRAHSDTGARASRVVPLSTHVKNVALWALLLLYAVAFSLLFPAALTASENDAVSPVMLVGP